MPVRSLFSRGWFDPSSHSAARFWAGWWVALWLVWLLLVDTFQVEEVVAGMVGAAVAATVATAVREQGYMSFFPRGRWLLEVPALAGRVIADSGVLAAALWRHVVRGQPVHGSMVRVPFDHGGLGGRDAARRALVNVGVSLTPNSFVIDIDPEGDILLVHRLVPGPLDPVLRRQQERAERALP